MREDTTSPGPMPCKRVNCPHSFSKHLSARWTAFATTSSDRIKFLSSCSPCYTSILGLIRCRLLSSCFVVSVFASFRRDGVERQSALLGPSGHGKSFLARSCTSVLHRLHHALCELNMLPSRLSSWGPNSYSERNDLTVYA
jgi:hypothetical protein